MTAAPSSRTDELGEPVLDRVVERREHKAGLTSGPIASPEWQASRLDFVGDLDAVIAIVAVAAEGAQALLPAGLRLAPQTIAPDGRHPLLFMLGHQRNVRFALAAAGIDYLEFILAVPFVEPDGAAGRRAGPFGYMPCLLLDRRLPTVAGRLLLAYEKRRAVIVASDEAYRIASARTGEPLLSARFGAAARFGQEPESPIREVLQLPVISRRAHGGWRYSVVDLALDRATIAPIEVHLTIERAFARGLPTGSFTLDAGGGRACRLRTRWRLTGPLARRSPPEAAGAGQSSAEAVT